MRGAVSHQAALLYPLDPMATRLALIPFLLFGLGYSASSQGGPSERVLELTLDDALRIAVEHNLDLATQEIATDVARFNALGSWGAFDPLLTLNAGLSESEFQGSSSLSGGTVLEEDSESVSGSLALPLRTGGDLSLSYDRTNTRTNNQFAAFDVSTTDVATVALTQPLLRGAWSRYATATQREAEIAHAKERAREREVEARLRKGVYDAYWSLVSAEEQLAVRERAVELGREQLARENRRLEVGSGTEVDVLQAETNVAQQEEQRLRAQADLRAAEDVLRTLLFQSERGEGEERLSSWDWPIRPTTPLPATRSDAVYDWMASFDRALGARAELEAARLEIDASEVRFSKTRSERRPRLDLELSSSSAGFGADPSDALDTALGWDFPTHRAGLIFSAPIRNQTARYAERAARAGVRSARLAYDKAELDVLAQVRSAVRDVSYQTEAVAAAQTSRELAERQLDAERARHDVGISTTFQVLQFQQDLAEALSAERAAQAAYAKALAALAHAEGDLAQSARAR